MLFPSFWRAFTSLIAEERKILNAYLLIRFCISTRSSHHLGLQSIFCNRPRWPGGPMRCPNNQHQKQVQISLASIISGDGAASKIETTVAKSEQRRGQQSSSRPCRENQKKKNFAFLCLHFAKIGTWRKGVHRHFIA